MTPSLLRRALSCVAAAWLAAAVIPVPVSAAPAQDPTVDFGCYSVSVTTPTTGPALQAVRLEFANGSSFTYTKIFNNPEDAYSVNGLGGQEPISASGPGNLGQVVSAVTVTRADGSSSRQRNPHPCDGSAASYTAQGITAEFVSCTKVSVTGSGLRKLIVSGILADGGYTADEITGTGDGITTLSASIPSGVIERAVVVADGRALAVHNIRAGCVPSAMIRSDVDSSGSTAWVVSRTCFDGGMAIRNGSYTKATVFFSDGSSQSFTFTPPVVSFEAPAPENATPTKAVVSGSATDYDFTDQVYTASVSCRSVDGTVTRFVDDVTDLDPATGGTADVLGNDIPATGAELRDDTLSIVDGDATVVDGKVVVAPFTDRTSVTYKVCDTYNTCGSATLTVIAASPKPSAALNLFGGAVPLVIVLSLISGAMWWLLAARRRKRTDDVDADDTDLV
jgi:hypothetical protein